MMRRFSMTILIVFLSLTAFAETIRGPVVATVEVDPAGPMVSGELGLNEIVLAAPAGDLRFLDALDVEITVPSESVEIPGALSLMITTTGTLTERAGVAEINGTVALSAPLTRAGRVRVHIPLRSGVAPETPAVAIPLDPLAGPDDLPIAITVVSQMKGTPPAIANARFPITVRPVPRDIGALVVSFPLEDGTEFQTDSYRAPEFRLAIDGSLVTVQSEYLLAPGIHRITLESDIYQDQSLTVGVEQARSANLSVPLLRALAGVTYTAPRGARVYVDGAALAAETGDFTAPPGEHTIVVVVGDYTVTKRFSVEEGREYRIAVTMDIAVEEAK